MKALMRNNYNIHRLPTTAPIIHMNKIHKLFFFLKTFHLRLSIL